MKKAATVWIGRPRRRALPLARQLQKRGLTPLIKPAMRICKLKKGEDGAMQSFLQAPKKFDRIIFVSEEAVRRVDEFFQRPFSGGIPIPTLAVGETTRAAANRLAALAVAAESPGDSDSLLRLSCLQADSIAGKNIAVVGGESNLPNSLSPTLCSELQKRGARVVAAAVYRRLPPPPAPDVAECLRDGIVQAAAAYSGETAANMLAMVGGGASILKNLPLFVMHRRIAAAAKNLGYRKPILAPADSEAMAQCIADYFSGRQ